MKERINKLLLLSLPMMWAGNLGGWAITDRLAGASASAEFLRMSVISSSSLFVIQAALYFSARERLSRQLLLISVGGLSLVWFMVCLVVPIFWMPTVSGFTKAGLAVLFFALFVSHCWTGVSKFNASWNKKKPDIAKYFNCQGATLDWDGIVKPLRVTVSIFVPGIPIWVEALLSVLLLLFMFLGLNLREIYPTFSVFAWGIPSLVIASGIVQMLAINVAQAQKVVELESIVGTKIRCAQLSQVRRGRKRR